MDAKILGNFISSHRKALGMTQTALAAKLGVTDKAVSKWERGGGLPDISMLEPLALALEVNLLDLIKGEHNNTAVDPEKQANESIKEALEYAQIKIQKATSCCIPALICMWILLLLGTCLIYYYIDNVFIRSICNFLLVLATAMVGRTLRELLRL